MPKVKEAERRLYPRIEQKLPVKIAANGYDFITTTKNLSCVGAYCHVDKYVPPFTKVKVKIDMPLKTKDNKKKIEGIICTGVIVRTDDEKNRGFNLAILFNEINAMQRHKISQYISQFLPQESSCP